MPFERFSWTTAIRWYSKFLRLNVSKYYLIYMRKAIHVLGILNCGTSLHRKMTMSSTMIGMRIFTTWCGWYDFMREALLIHFWLAWHDNGEPNISVDALGERCKYDIAPITHNNLEFCWLTSDVFDSQLVGAHLHASRQCYCKYLEYYKDHIQDAYLCLHVVIAR